MRIADQGKRKRVLLEPGEYFATREDLVISTLLGSCVAVCLFDPIAGVMGMNHFLLVYPGGKKQAACLASEGRRGKCAMENLLVSVLQLGARQENLQAKAFGGASMFVPFAQCAQWRCLSAENINFAKTFLEEAGIPLVGEDLGGDVGRMIHFSFGDFTVYVRKTKKSDNFKLIPRDQNLAQRLVLS